MTIFDYIKAIYKKTPIELENITVGLNLALSKWLLYDEDNIAAIEKSIPYIFYIDPKNYFILLYCNIKYKKFPPYLHKLTEKEIVSENILLLKIAEYFKWSQKELIYYKPFLLKKINQKYEYWQKQFGIKI